MGNFVQTGFSHIRQIKNGLYSFQYYLFLVSGAIGAATLVLNITAIVIAVIAFVAFLNAMVSFFAGLVGFPELTFETILGTASSI